MAYSSFVGERPDLAARPFHPLRTFAGWIVAARAKRAQRSALRDLLDFDAARLRDLGIERHDVIEVLRGPYRSAGLKLSARRARSAREWLDRS